MWHCLVTFPVTFAVKMWIDWLLAQCCFHELHLSRHRHKPGTKRYIEIVTHFAELCLVAVPTPTKMSSNVASFFDVFMQIQICTQDSPCSVRLIKWDRVASRVVMPSFFVFQSVKQREICGTVCRVHVQCTCSALVATTAAAAAAAATCTLMF